jgi:hypothetical protein
MAVIEQGNGIPLPKIRERSADRSAGSARRDDTRQLFGAGGIPLSDDSKGRTVRLSRIFASVGTFAGIFEFVGMHALLFPTNSERHANQGEGFALSAFRCSLQRIHSRYRRNWPETCSWRQQKSDAH